MQNSKGVENFYFPRCLILTETCSESSTIIPQRAGNRNSDDLNFKISKGSMPPDHPQMGTPLAAHLFEPPFSKSWIRLNMFSNFDLTANSLFEIWTPAWSSTSISRFNKEFFLFSWQNGTLSFFFGPVFFLIFSPRNFFRYWFFCMSKDIFIS